MQRNATSEPSETNVVDFDGGMNALGCLNYSQAGSFFEKAAAAGNSAAMYQISLLYENGNGVNADPKAAIVKISGGDRI